MEDQVNCSDLAATYSMIHIRAKNRHFRHYKERELWDILSRGGGGNWCGVEDHKYASWVSGVAVKAGPQ